MAPPESTRAALDKKLAELPQQPGCYLMRDKKGDIFYIGKAQNLRSRVRSYFNGSDSRAFVAWLDDLLYDLDIVVVQNAKEALLLERTLVREHKPRFNVLLKDDKNFIHLRLRTKLPKDGAKKRHRYPRLEVVRNPKDDGARYFGPYHSASSVRQSLRWVNRYFQLRTCSDSVLENRKRPCLQYQIGRCPAPCVVEVASYPDHVAEAALFLSGKGDALIQKLEQRMWTASEGQDFETAARLRDQAEAVRTSFAKQVVTEVARRKNQDIVAACREGALLEIARVTVRGGRMLNTETYSFDRQEFPTDELVGSFLSQLYAEMLDEDLPDEVLLNLEPGEDFDELAKVLTERRGRKVWIKQPARGGLKRLVGIAEQNAQLKLTERLKKSDTRQRAMQNLMRRLRLQKLPRVIECFDVSLFQGTDAVASKVCFVDGAPDKARYRRYKIRSVDGTDDFLMMYEVLGRRLKKVGPDDPLPDLLLVDGGKGQLKMAETVCAELGIDTGPGGLALCSIAKSRVLDETNSAARDDANLEEREVERSFERLFIPGAKDPLLLKPHTHERYLVEQVRDEAHRFAIEFHRKRRKRRTLKSALDGIPGVGPKKRKALLTSFGSVANIKTAHLKHVAETPGIGEKLARVILAHLTADDKSEAGPAGRDG